MTTKDETFAKGIYGDKLYQKRARLALPVLVQYAKNRRSVTYSQLAKLLNMPNPRNLDKVLGAIGNSLAKLSTTIQIDIPPINCLVINKNTDIPGDGLFGFLDMTKDDFHKLPVSEQLDKIDQYHEQIFTFDRWDNVLTNLDLRENTYFDLDSNVEALLEGGSREHITKIMKRNPKARLECIAHYGNDCQICEFSFKEYADIGKGYIQVHHKELLSEKDEEYIINPVEDLIPVCANCHVMLHSKTPPYTVDELKEKMYRP